MKFQVIFCNTEIIAYRCYGQNQEMNQPPMIFLAEILFSPPHSHGVRERRL
jgi:hypothetical protein